MSLEALRDIELPEMRSFLDHMKMEASHLHRLVVEHLAKLSRMQYRIDHSLGRHIMEAVTGNIVIFFSIFNTLLLPCHIVTASLRKPSIRVRDQLVWEVNRRRKELLEDLLSQLEPAYATLSRLETFVNTLDAQSMTSAIAAAVLVEYESFKGQTKSLRELLLKVMAERVPYV